VAAAALGGFAYWAVHGSFDWFWEFAGLGAPAFALLGLACGLAPSGPVTRADPVEGAPRRVPRARLALLVAGAVAALAAAGSLAAPWLSRLEVQDAAHIWSKAPAAAYSRLDEAAQLNPLSDEPNLIAGSIALRYGDLVRADHQFRLALERSPGGAYATLERGAIASARGNRAAALSLLSRAARLNPRDPLPREALRVAQAGQRVSIGELNRLILLKARQLG
jgi:tetratricopeptide (TPR) repeat protein